MKLQIDRAAGHITSNFQSVRSCRIFTDAPTRSKMIRGDEREAYGKDLPDPREVRLALELRLLEAKLSRPAFLIREVARLRAEVEKLKARV